MYEIACLTVSGQSIYCSDCWPGCADCSPEEECAPDYGEDCWPDSDCYPTADE